jgi:photosystem II stability/assembly factor-like uncharacterized protein
MTVRPPVFERPPDSQVPPPPEVLFKEAHERRRRRWIRTLAVLVVAAAGAGISYGAIGNGGYARASKSAASASNRKAPGNTTRSSTGTTLCGSGAVAVTNCLIALSFVSSEVGFGVYSGMSVTGDSRPPELFSTTDGGVKWHEVGRAPVGFGQAAVDLPTLTFVDHSNGIEYGTAGAFVTHVGGRSWTPIPLPGRVVASTAVGRRLWLTDTTCTQSPSTASCTVGVEASSDAGRTWRALDLPSEPFRAAEIAVGTGGTLVVAEWADQEGYVSNNPGVLLVSGNSGARWQSASLPCPANFRLGGQLSLAPSSHTLWLTCSGGGAVGTRPNVVYRSTDLGTSWVAESSYPPALAPTARLPPGAPNGTIEVLAARSSTDAWVLEMNRGGLLATSDGGRSWHESMPPSIQRGIDTTRDTLDMVSPTRAYLASHALPPLDSGGLWCTEDGGRTWRRLR